MTLPVCTLESRCYNDSQNNSHYEYDVSIFNNVVLTTVTNSPSVVDQWILETKSIHSQRNHTLLGLKRKPPTPSPLLIGLDTEWRPFCEGNPVAILQLCIGNRCLIFQLLHASNVPMSLKNFFLDQHHVFVGVGVGNDAMKLSNDYDLDVSKTVDLNGLARRKLSSNTMTGANVNTPGLKFLTRQVLGWEIQKPKRVTMSQWDNETLSLEQIEYACVDAFVSFEIGRIWKVWKSE